jgi:hypothetical protein
MRMFNSPPARGASSPDAIITRLATDLGVPEADAQRAAALLRSGRADLLEHVLTGRLTVDRALELARQRRRL